MPTKQIKSAEFIFTAQEKKERSKQLDTLAAGLETKQAIKKPNTPPAAATKNEWSSLPEDILEEALRITGGARNQDYGPPRVDFKRTAGMWTSCFVELLKEGTEFKPEHVAQAMIMVKLSRLQNRPKRDSVVDIAGYARCMDSCLKDQVGYVP